MPKNFIAVVLFFISFFAFSQNALTVKGKLLDENSKTPLESATVYLTSKKDSTVIDYTISDKTGRFLLEIRKATVPMDLRVSFIGYQGFRQNVEEGASILDLGEVLMKVADNTLEGVVLKFEAPPIRIKNDTLEFDAASFKVGTDANVEKLLRQLPGVEIAPDGKITVNGKQVNQILVNGKPFFGKDGKIATQNLPAEIIEKIQIVDTKTKEEELSGDAASSEEKTINLTIQEEKNKGFFGKIMGGYGTEERYESSLLLNWFKGDRKFSVLASANNINSVGFSMDEIFDNMGGGRNSSVYYSDDGTFGINGMSFGGNNGITTSNLLGLNYVDKWFTKVDMSSNYFFTNAESSNTNKTFRTNLLPTGTTFTNSDSNSSSKGNNHNISFDFEMKLDSTATVYMSPKFSKRQNKSSFNSNQKTTNEANVITNESNSNTLSDIDVMSFENNIYFFKSFKKKQRGMTISIDNEHKKTTEFTNLNSATLFYLDDRPDDIRNQNQNNIRKFNKIGIEIRFGEPLTDSLKLSATTEIMYYASDDVENTFNFNDSTGNYDQFNAEQSNGIVSSVFKINPTIGLNLQKKNIKARFNIGPELVYFKNQSDYLGVQTNLNKNYIFPSIASNLNYTISKGKSIYSSYNFKRNLPLANQILPVINLSNPLNTIVGNENLKPTSAHNTYLNFNNYDWQTRVGTFLYGGFTYYQNQIVSSTIYDENFKAETTYENVDKGLSSYFGISWSKSFKKEKRTFRISAGLNSEYRINQGLTNAALFESKAWQLEPKININWSIEELITIAPSYRYSYNTSKFTNYVIDNANNFVHKFNIELTNYWPKHFVFGNDFGYTYNSNIADGFQKDFYLWNMSLGYNFYKDRLLAKIKVYDVLNQNVGVQRTITPTAITDTENNVLQQYFMFSLTYKLDKFGGKKEDGNGIIIFD